MAAGALALLSGAVVLVGILVSVQPALGAHSESFVVPGVPFDGSWGYRYAASCPVVDPPNDSSTVPRTHQRPAGGDFGVDYYACTGTPGRFYALNWGSGNTYAYVGEKKGSCVNQLEFKGFQYRLDLYNGEGKRGEYRTLHVGVVGYADGVMWRSFGNPQFELSVGQLLVGGSLIGFTGRWGAASSCYDVNNDYGAHWHLEAANASEVGHYACFYYRPAGNQMWASDSVGITGANITTVNTACP